MNQNFFQKSTVKHAGEIQCRTFSKLVDCGSCIFFPDRQLCKFHSDIPEMALLEAERNAFDLPQRVLILRFLFYNEIQKLFLHVDQEASDCKLQCHGTLVWERISFYELFPLYFLHSLSRNQHTDYKSESESHSERGSEQTVQFHGSDP